ncbi:hypothetical protein QUB33_04320 [Microcoleus sp. B3-A4]|uniref:hypothetical protein n=1 Tax=Microcoleus sp. B3-A4 TaxID=2818653 RepID=UPI002FD28437
MNRPQSVTVLAILQLISCIFSLLEGLLILLLPGFFGGLGAAVGGANVGTVIGSFIAIFAALSFILGFLSLLLTWGLFHLKNWAWTGTLIVHIIATLAQIVKMFGSGGTAVNFLTLGFAVASIYYLQQPDVKQAFRV